MVTETEKFPPMVGYEGLLRATLGVRPGDIRLVGGGRGKGRGYRETVFDIPIRSVSLDSEGWLTGFWEGDGSYGRESQHLSFSQKFPQVLIRIQEELEGGNLILPSRIRGMFGLVFGKLQAEILLGILSRHLVSPGRLGQLSLRLEELDLAARLHLPSKAWTAGFWDAEGFSHAGSRHLVIGIGQMDRVPLDGLLDLWSFGKVGKSGRCYYWTISSSYSDEGCWTLGKYLMAVSRNPQKRAKLLQDFEEVYQMLPSRIKG